MSQAIAERMDSFLVDSLLPPEHHTVVHLTSPDLEGLCSTRLSMAYPFDPALGKALVKTCSFLLKDCRTALFGYVSRAELFLLLEVDTYRERRSAWDLVSRMSASGSAWLTSFLGVPVPMLARVHLLPNPEVVEEFFEWQQELGRRAAMLEAYRAAIRSRGVTLDVSQEMLGDLTLEELSAMLEENRVDLSSIPSWQSGGTGIYRKSATEPDAPLLVDTELPLGPGFRVLLQQFTA